MKLRPARTMRTPNSQAWSRYSVKKPKKSYVKALPHTSLLVFRMGVDKPSYELSFRLCSNQRVQIRSNSLEAARQVANKHLEREIPGNYFFRVVTYPHNVIREKKRATGAGADRLSQGMSLSFGKGISVAARVGKGQGVIEVKADKNNRRIAMEALKRAASKLSGTYKIEISEMLKSKGTAA